jgi:hypothetical protein
MSADCSPPINRRSGRRAAGIGRAGRQRGVCDRAFARRAAGLSPRAGRGPHRSAVRRPLRWPAGSSPGSNVASGGGTPDLATPVRAVTKSGVHDRRVGGVAETGGRSSVGQSTSPLDRRHVSIAEKNDAGRRSVSRGFQNASIAAIVPLGRNPPFAGTSRVEPAGFEPATSCVQSRRSPN